MIRTILTSGSMRSLRHKPDRSCATKPGHTACHRQSGPKLLFHQGVQCKRRTFPQFPDPKEPPMARVTVEDCIDKVENRFELVLLAAHRARLISQGAPLTIDRDRDKNPVVALREIGDSTIQPDDLREQLIHSLQKYVEVDEPEAE